MISIVCVYNKKELLTNDLLKSLKRQNRKYDFVGVDNTKNRFKSAAEALNYGFTLTNQKSNYVFFVHQDVVLENKNDLQKIEIEIKKIKKMGVAGFAGKDNKNNRIGFIKQINETWGSVIYSCKKVCTLDECGLIISREIFEKHKFDSDVFDGWHCYGADYCLWANENDLKVIVLPIGIRHNCTWQAFLDNKLYYYQKKLLKKYNYHMIYMTCGKVSTLALSIKIIISKIKIIIKRIING